MVDALDQGELRQMREYIGGWIAQLEEQDWQAEMTIARLKDMDQKRDLTALYALHMLAVLNEHRESGVPLTMETLSMLVWQRVQRMEGLLDKQHHFELSPEEQTELDQMQEQP